MKLKSHSLQVEWLMVSESAKNRLCEHKSIKKTK